MSPQAPIVYCQQEETARLAHAAFPKGNAYLRVYDALGPIYTNPQFAALFPRDGQPAVAPAQLALVRVPTEGGCFQFAEGLSDRQAADAVRDRISWKYALCLPLDDAGFDASVLSEFRARLVAGKAEYRLLDLLLECCKAEGLVKARGTARTDSTHVLAATRALNRLETVGETMRHALNTLASVAPGWLRPRIESEWLARYGPCVTDLRHARYIGLAKTRLRHVITSATPGTRLRVICRLSDWFAERPRASVRITPFVELATASPQFVPTREDRQQ